MSAMSRDYAINLSGRLVTYYSRLEMKEPGRWTTELDLARRFEASVKSEMDRDVLSKLLEDIEKHVSRGGTALEEMLYAVKILVDSRL